MSYLGDAACHDCCERWTETGGRGHDPRCLRDSLYRALMAHQMAATAGWCACGYGADAPPQPSGAAIRAHFDHVAGALATLVTKPLARTLADNLEPWWRCIHTQEPMGPTMVVHECRRCLAERDEVGAFLATALGAGGAA